MEGAARDKPSNPLTSCMPTFRNRPPEPTYIQVVSHLQEASEVQQPYSTYSVASASLASSKSRCCSRRGLAGASTSIVSMGVEPFVSLRLSARTGAASAANQGAHNTGARSHECCVSLVLLGAGCCSTQPWLGAGGCWVLQHPAIAGCWVLQYPVSGYVHM